MNHPAPKVGPPRGRSDAFREGLRRGAGPGAATFVFGLSYGATALSSGWGRVAPLVFSALSFSGSAQFVVLVSLGTGVVPAVLAGALMNVRYVVMSIAVNGSLTGSRLRRALSLQTLADASFAIAHRGGGVFDRRVLAGSCLPQWTAWVGGTAVGVLASPGPALTEQLGLDVAFPAFFLLLVIDEMRQSRRAVVAALLGAACTGGALVVLPGSVALLAALAGALAAARLVRRTERTGRTEDRPADEEDRR